MSNQYGAPSGMVAKKKLQVFVSSPFEGMEDFRRSVMEGVVRAGHVPILLENFSFSNQEDIPVIVNALRDCQVYILLLGHRYGSQVSESSRKTVIALCPGLKVPQNISFTELEYRLAKHFENPTGDGDQERLAIYTILTEKEQVREKRKVDPESGKGLKDTQQAKRDQLFWRFYDNVSKEKKFGKPLDDKNHEAAKATLRLEIPLALGTLDTSHLRGWIPEPKGMPATMITAVSRNYLVQSIIGSLGLFGSLDKRLAREPELKQRAGQFFWMEYGEIVFRENINLFFESGSTVAFLADAVGKQIAGRHKVASNNILAHLLLWLVHRGTCEMFPSTTPDPEDQFGATFGEHIDGLYDERSLVGAPPEPDYSGGPLDNREKEAIEKVLKEAAAPNRWKGKTLLLGATSGIRMSGSPVIKWGKGTEKTKELEHSINMCYGFHVGSYKNKLFKRFMYETNLPLMVFLDESKIDCEIEVGRCHFIFERKGFTWQKFLKTYPLAFCVGCHAGSLGHYTRLFEDRGFEIVPDKGTFVHRAFIARNAVFAKHFGH